jgi:lysophospholipase L1-like esterase
VAASIFRYVALGDSTGVVVGSHNDGGYPERLYQRMKRAGIRAGIMNLSLSGATTSDLLAGPLHKAVEVRPALVTLGIGSNDLWRLVPVSGFAMNLGAIADALASTGAHVVVSNIIDLSRAPIAAMIDALQIPKAVLVARILDFNARIAELAKRPRFTVVDLFSVSVREGAAFAQLFGADGFHPSSIGYERWTDELWPHVEPIGRAWAPAQG